MPSVRRALAPVAVTGALTFGVVDAVEAAPVAAVVVAPAHHNTDPNADGRVIGMCHVFSGGGWLGGPCPEGHRPYIPAEQLGGANRIETGRLIWQRATNGGWEPGTVFVGRIEDGSALGLAAEATDNGAVVVVAGRGDDVDQAALDQLVALHAEERPALVIVGGDSAMGVQAQVAVAIALFWGAA